MKVLYFAWLRERVGRAEEEIEVPPDVETVGDLIGWLKDRGPEYAAAFDGGAAVRAAVDHSHSGPEAPLAGAREVAFFPPMTGG